MIVMNSNSKWPRRALIWTTIGFIFYFCAPLYAAQVNLAWDETNPSCDGYHIYMRTQGSAYNYDSPVWSGKGPTCTVGQLNEGTYYFVSRAYLDGNVSPISNEVAFTVQPTAPIDSDGDGISDADETNIYGTDPYSPDSDGDGFTDGEELNAGTDPVDPDSHVSSNTPATNGEIILDNGGEGTATDGTWKTSRGKSYYGSLSVYSNEVGASYTFKTAISGAYEVSLWWTEHSNRSSEVPVEIWSGTTLLDTVIVNQQENGGQWNVLGTYNFSGAANIVVVSEWSNVTTCADAVKFNSSEIIIDNGDAGTSSTGSWGNSSAPNSYGSTSVYGKSIGDTYTFEVSINGTTEISLWWTEHSNRSNQVPVQVFDGNQLLDEVYVNQEENGGQWNTLGTYTFAESARLVIVSDTNNYSACADAVKFLIK